MKSNAIMKNISPTTSLNDIDPAIAWEAWGPSAEEPWDRRRVCLLYRRSAFGCTEQQIETALKSSPAEVIKGIVQPNTSDAEAEKLANESTQLAASIRASGKSEQLATWWLHRMLNTRDPLLERMTMFWHGHFATGAEKVLDVDLMYEQNVLLRKYALGDFRKLVHEISKDPAMLIYLDSVTNRKAHANENYARELMELFCLGEGNYTEHDVQELAKCFTGWEIRRKQFRFNPYQHDGSTKTILGTAGIESGESAIDVVLASQDMPRFIVGKLFQFFVCDEPQPNRALLEPLENLFVKSGFEVRPVVEAILASRLMLSGWSIGRKVRSPVDLAIGLLRTMQATTNMGMLTERLRFLGQSLFYPPNVKGWPGGRNWINSSTLIGRTNLVYDLVRDENTRFDGGTLSSLAKSLQRTKPESWFDWLTSVHFTNEPSETERKKILDKVSGLSGDEMAKQTIIELAKLPRIHLS